jgi:NitT/TauT family transport system permease protein
MKKYIYPLISLLVLFAVWEIIILVFSIPEFLLPQPSSILILFVNTIGTMWPHFVITFYEAILGFSLAVVIGIFLSSIFELSDIAKKSLYPYVIVIRLAPVIAIAPFLILWFGNGILSKVITATIMSIFFIIVSLTKGFSEVDPDSLDLMNSLSASKWQILTKLKMPNAIPYLFSGLKMAVATSVAGAVVAEFVGSNKGLGYLILTNFYYLKTTQMFASLLFLFIGGMMFFGLVSLAEEKFFKKYSVGEKV